jgi:hypothetical protein
MKYWMKFYDKNELVISLSDIVFMGKDLNIPELKERWNDAFVIKRLASSVEISFLGNKVNKTFVAGYRDNKLVVIDTDTKQEYTPKEFSSNLNMIENILNGTKSLAV